MRKGMATLVAVLLALAVTQARQGGDTDARQSAEKTIVANERAL